MATSLQEQLRRLRAPQTSLLFDSKKRPSILFDQKDAAEKSRQKIYDIGYSGLLELIAINPSFQQFKQTLFDQNTIELERAVESTEINEILDNNIKKFLQHLSPFFMLEPAHKCLEWLIRRFHIHDFNKKEFIALILPYHETMIFVKCVQIMNLKDPNDQWHWLRTIQKPGIPLPKSAILSRAANDSGFLKFICKSTIQAIKELDNKAYMLQAHINFYCITIIGAIENCNEIKELFVGNILQSLLKGLASNIIDFTAAVFMIIAQLVMKTKLNPKLLSAFIENISTVSHVKLQSDMILLLILIYQKQGDNFNEFPETVLIKFVSNTWLTTTLASLATQSISISALCSRLIGSCLRRVQAKEDGWITCKLFLENILNDIHFTAEDEAKTLIRTTLDNYHRHEPPSKLKEGEIIELDDSDDDVDISPLDEDVQVWYSSFLQSLEKQYPAEFDFTIKETLQGQGIVSESRRQALKIVLAFRFKSSYSEDNTLIYENLYHHNVSNRIEAVKYLVKNLSNLKISENSLDLLRDSLADRLNDDNPKVVAEVLKLSTNSLVKMLSVKVFTDILVDILNKSQTYPELWKKTISRAIGHIINPEMLKDGDKNYIFLTLLPYLMPRNDDELIYVKEILLSKSFLKVSSFLKSIASALQQELAANNWSNVTRIVLEAINSAKTLPLPEEYLKLAIDIGDKFFQKSTNFSCFLLIISSCYREGTDSALALEILKFIEKYQGRFQFIYSNEEDEWIFTIRSNKIPLELYRNLLETLAVNTKLTDLNNFSNKFSISLKLFIKIYDILLTKSCTSEKREKISYSCTLKRILDKVFPKHEQKLEFLSNFYVVDRLEEDGGEKINSALQIRSLKICNLVLNASEQNFTVDRNVFIKILIGLTSKISVIRQFTLETIKFLANCNGLDEKWRKFAERILQRTEEILMDEEQFPLILFTIISPKRNTKDESNEEKDNASKCLTELIQFINEDIIADFIKVEILEMLKHINNIQIFKKLLKIPLDILNETTEQNTEDKMYLDKVKSRMFKLILSRFDDSTITIVREDNKAWELIEKSLKLHRISIVNNGKIRSLACEIMDIFTDSIYDKLPEERKEKFIHPIVNAVTFAEDTALPSTANIFIRKINLNAKNIVGILMEMKFACKTSAASKKQKTSKVIAPDVSSLNSTEWKMGITLLEFLQNKKKLEQYHVLIPILFELLQKCLEFEEQSTLEYAKQLILSCLLHCCQKVSSTESQKMKPIISESLYRTDLVVQCIRATQNPQTHHHALLLLSHLALMLPQQVLHNMMDIFTFMGSSVVRHDDTFSFQIISNIIESVVPTLVKANNYENSPEKQDQLVIPVLKVFVDIALDVPEHRRLPLYIKLLRTLGASQYLWMFLCLLFESHVVHDTASNSNDKGVRPIKRFPTNIEDFPKRIEIAFHLIKDFEPTIILQTCINIFDYIQKLPMNDSKDGKDEKMEVDITDSQIFNISGHSAKQLRHYKYVILQFISTLTSSTELVNAIVLLNDEETLAMKPFYQNFIIKILTFIPIVTKAMEENSNTKQENYWKILIHHCYNILDNAISFLSPDMLLVVVRGLLHHQLPAVRKKVIEILITKLQYKTDYFSNCKEENLLQLLEPLNEIIESILGKKKLMENATANEIMFIQQMALIALKLLSKIMALKYVEEFKDILIKLTKILKKREEAISKIILATVVLAITEISANLKAHSIAHLSKFMPNLVEVLQEQAESLERQSPDNVCIAIVTGIQKLFVTLPLFLGPYIVDVLSALTLLWVRILPYQDREPRTAIVINKLDTIWNKISSIIPLRVIVPNCEKTYKKLMENGHYECIKFLMKLLTECFHNVPAVDIQQLQNELTTLFLQAFDFRADLIDYGNQSEVADIEEHILQAFVAHILKLSETYFRPLYHKIYDWTIRNSTVKDKIITYFLLSSKVAEALKSLFTLFASDFIQDAADLLDKCNSAKTNDLYFSDGDDDDDKNKNAILIEGILKTLYNVFLHDSKGFVNPHRFDILMQPLVDQLENRIILENAERKESLIACLSQLAVAVSSDTLWKQLNYQILLKTRSNNPEHRILAFSCCVEIVQKLGESFSPLLPETIPFIAELFEDENDKVEKFCRKGVQQMEKILGESLQSYF